jgi:phosphoglucomutase
MLAADDEVTPTPVVSHAILTHNRARAAGLADGIVITPSHNPPDNGGFKYNPPNGGPADTSVTDWIQTRANGLLRGALNGVKRVPYAQALRAATTQRHDFRDAYVRDLGNVIDMDAIRASGIHLGVDPLGGAGVHYWGAIAERYGLNLTVISEEVDPTFRFMTVDWDGRIRMDPSSSYAMQRLIGVKERFDIAFGCDTDHDRYGIVTRAEGLLPADHYLAVAIRYLFQHRPEWREQARVGKTVVSSWMAPAAARVEAPATAAQRKRLSALSPKQLRCTELAGEEIVSILDRAPGNDAPLGGVKVIAKSGWFVARPSGTEEIYKIYAESFRGEEHLARIVEEAQAIVDATLASA